MITLDAVRAALNLPDFDPDEAHRSMAALPRSLRPAAGQQPRQAGVLALIYPEAKALHLILTRRTDALRGHSGQISFPGGERDPQDHSFEATALRETCEELGICENSITTLGRLTPVYIPPSNFQVHPIVAALPQLPPLKPNPGEVAEVLSLSLDALLDARTKAEEVWRLHGTDVAVRFYRVGQHRVWGATAAMLSELEHRLRAVLHGHRPNARK